MPALQQGYRKPALHLRYEMPALRYTSTQYCLNSRPACVEVV